MNAQPTIPVNDPWAYWWRLGYRDLVPVVPPNAPLRPGGKLAERLAAGEDARGKVPGVRGRAGQWSGMSGWPTWNTTEEDLSRWLDMGASIGVRGSAKLAAIDADTRDENLAGAIKEIVERHVGKAPIRIGNYPKALYLIRTSSPFPYTMIPFGPVHADNKRDRVEILTTGKQFVVYGEHATTGKPYHWPRQPVPFEDLVEVSPEILDAMMAEIKSVVPQPGEIHKDGAAIVEVDQAALRGNVVDVRRAVAAIGNTTAQFPNREDWIDHGYRIKGALGEAGREVWLEYCAAWKDEYGRVNDDSLAEANWERIKPPFRVGAPSLYRMADKVTGGAFTAARFHEDVPPDPPAPHFSEPATCFDGLAVPTQAWLAPDLIPARNVTLFYGDGGTGKSLASLQLAFAVSTGTPWLGVPVTRGKALFISAEDERDEIHRRIAAISSGSGYGLDELGDLYVRSLSGQNALLAEPDPKTTLLKTTPLYATIRAEIARLRPALIVLDTLADMFGGDELKRVHARQFIQFLQRYVVDVDFELSVVLLGQPSVSGMNSGSGTSGSTAWSNSVRSRLYLERRYVERAEKKIETDTDIRILTTKKANRTKLGGEIVMRWLNGRFVLDAASSAVQETADDAADETVFLALLAQFTKTGRNVSHNVAAPSYAPKQFLTTKAGSDLGKARLASAMARLFDRHEIKVEVYGAPSKGYNRIIGVGREGL